MRCSRSDSTGSGSAGWRKALIVLPPVSPAGPVRDLTKIVAASQAQIGITGVQASVRRSPHRSEGEPLQMREDWFRA